jgi:hypothetical protein
MSKETILRCANCGQHNRIIGGAVDTRNYSCGRCKAKLHASRLFRNQTFRLCLLCLAGVFAWASWPTSIWLALTLFGGFFLIRRAHWMLRPHELDKWSRIKPVLAHACKELGKGMLYVAAGIAMVCVAQIALSQVENLSAETMRNAEDFLSEVRSSVHRVLGFQNIFAALVIIVAISMMMPHVSLLPTFTSIRQSVVSVYFVLLGLTSFTFFSQLTIEQQEEQWMKPLRLLARPYLEERDRLSREILGAAWTEKILKNLKEDQRKEISPYFKSSGQNPRVPSGGIVQLARRLANTAPHLEEKTVRAPSATQDYSASARSYLVEGAPTTHDSPTLTQAKFAAGELKKNMARLQTVRNAAIEVVSQTLSEVLSGTIDKQLAKVFVEELVSSLAREALHGVVPRVDSLDKGRVWVQANVDVPAPADVKPSTKWGWNSTTLSPRATEIPTEIPRPFGPHLEPHVAPRFEPHPFHFRFSFPR